MPGELLHNCCLYAVKRNTEPGRSLIAAPVRLRRRARSPKLNAQSLHVKMYLGLTKKPPPLPLFYFPSVPCKCDVVTGGIKWCQTSSRNGGGAGHIKPSRFVSKYSQCNLGNFVPRLFMAHASTEPTSV